MSAAQNIKILPVGIQDIEAARKRISGHVLATPFLNAPQLSKQFDADIWIKYENMQATNSFKERGALNKLLQLSDKEKKQGVIAVSAGNHAQAVAYHAARLKIPATIVMPTTTPGVKIEATERYGAKIVLSGETVSDCEARMNELQVAHNLTLIHPYDDVAVIAGQGTIGLEMLESAPDLDCIIIPVGGGGLASGIAIAVKTLKPTIRIITVESELYPSLWCKLHNKPFKAPTVGTLAEGIAVKNTGKLTYEILKTLSDDLLLVSEAAIEWAINAYLETLKTLAEGAGAAGLAALPQIKGQIKGKKIGIILCGGNIDPRMAATIMVRALEREEKIVAFRISITDRPGTLGRITTLLGELGANILEVEHRRLFLNISAKGAWLDITVEVRNAKHAKTVLDKLQGAGHEVTRIDSGEAGF
jgi:threonine dehydratase